MWRGVDNLYNYNFELSISNLDSVMIRQPKHTVAPFVKIAAQWMKAQVFEGYDSSYAVIYRETEKTIPYYEALIKENENDAEAFLYLGCTYGIRARVDLARKEWLNVLYSSYKGYKKIKQSEKLNPKQSDIYMPIGLLEYFAGMSPMPVKILANLFGITPDTELGIIHLEAAIDAKSYSWIESANVLTYCWLYFENDVEKAEKLSFELMNNFPLNPLFRILYAEALLRQGKLKKIEEILSFYENKIPSYPPILKNECELKIKYLNSILAFQLNDYQSALYNLQWIENNYQMEMDWLLGLTWLLKAKIFDIYNDRMYAVDYYEKAAKLDNSFAYINWAKGYCKKPYSGMKDDPYFQLDY